jgi:hypothetical protein
MLSAFDLYSYCPPCPPGTPYDAIKEQRVAWQAFTAIGYGGVDAYDRCYCEDWQ